MPRLWRPAFENLQGRKARERNASLERNDPDTMHDEITTVDHALTRPWSVDKTFRHNPNPYPAFSRISSSST